MLRSRGPQQGERSWSPGTIPTAAGCPSSSTRRRTASTRRSRSSRCITRRASLPWKRPPRNARRLGLRRRGFLVSACGAATALLGMNTAFARAGRTGGFYDIPQLAALENEVARSAVDGNEFIFDVQGHFVNPTGAWLKQLRAGGAAVAIRHRRSALQAARGPGRSRLPALHRAGPVREGRVPRFRHGPDGAVVRAVDRRARAAQDRGSRGNRARSSSASTARTGFTCTAA